MEKNKKNVIYVNDDFYEMCNERQRNKILMIAENKFNDRNTAEKWMQSSNEALQIWPDIILGTYKGYCMVLDAIKNERSDWGENIV